MNEATCHNLPPASPWQASCPFAFKSYVTGRVGCLLFLDRWTVQLLVDLPSAFLRQEPQGLSQKALLAQVRFGGHRLVAYSMLTRYRK